MWAGGKGVQGEIVMENNTAVSEVMDVAGGGWGIAEAEKLED